MFVTVNIAAPAVYHWTAVEKEGEYALECRRLPNGTLFRLTGPGGSVEGSLVDTDPNLIGVVLGFSQAHPPVRVTYIGRGLYGHVGLNGLPKQIDIRLAAHLLGI
jgi:hypothetical protein